jgi:hypothetical protein
MFQYGHQKYGGRKKGTLNRQTEEFRWELEKLGFNLPDKLVTLYNSIPCIQGYHHLKINLLKVIAYYSYPRPMADVFTQQLDDSAEQNARQQAEIQDLARLLPRNFPTRTLG